MCAECNGSLQQHQHHNGSVRQLLQLRLRELCGELEDTAGQNVREHVHVDYERAAATAAPHAGGGAQEQRIDCGAEC